MKILVTGAAGFIGYHLCSKLIENHNEVIGFDNINDYYDQDIDKKDYRTNKRPLATGSVSNFEALFLLIFLLSLSALLLIFLNLLSFLNACS